MSLKHFFLTNQNEIYINNKMIILSTQGVTERLLEVCNITTSKINPPYMIAKRKVSIFCLRSSERYQIVQLHNRHFLKSKKLLFLSVTC